MKCISRNADSADTRGEHAPRFVSHSHPATTTRTAGGTETSDTDEHRQTRISMRSFICVNLR